MSKINLESKSWCDLVFEGRNKEYGAYRLRATEGRRQLRAVIIVVLALIALFVIIFLTKAVSNAIGIKDNADSEQVTALAQLKKEEPKKEEKKIEQPKPEEPEVKKVAVKASIQFTVPKIVDQVDQTKKLKSQDEVTKSSFAIATKNYAGDSKNGINIDDLKDDQRAGGTTAPPKKEEVQDNALVEVPATFPGGEAALLKYVTTHTVYPEIAMEQGLQGVVVVRFEVGKDGSVGQAVIRKSLSRECDQAALKVVKSLPRFIPAKSQGRPVPVWFTLPVRFQLQ